MQVALARRESPTHGAGHVALALALTGQMPHTLAALEAGIISEWRATLIVRETAALTPDQNAPPTGHTYLSTAPPILPGVPGIPITLGVPAA